MNILPESIKIELNKYDIELIQQYINTRLNPQKEITLIPKADDTTTIDRIPSRELFVLATPEGYYENDTIEDAKEVLEELYEERLVDPEDCNVYKVFSTNRFDVQTNLELVQSQE